MPPIPRRDYSIPQPAGLQLGTDGRRVAFPAIRRAAQVGIGLVRRIFPTRDSYPVETAAQRPLRRMTPMWPKDRTAIILPPSPPNRR